MQKIFIIAQKELISTFRNRNLLVLMFLSPLLLSTIMGLAFGGLGSESAQPNFAHIPIAVVNQDRGLTLQNQLPATVTNPSLLDLNVTVGGKPINVGQQLLQNQKLQVQPNDLNAGNVSFNFGNQVAAILLSQPLTGTALISGSTGGFNLSNLSCPLLAPGDMSARQAFSGTLSDLFKAQAVTDPNVARAGVQRGDYAAAVIIGPGFSNQLAPHFGLSTTNTMTTSGAVEVFANQGTPISASIVRAVVEGVVGQFERMNVALSALLGATIDTVARPGRPVLDLSALNANVITQTLQTINASTFAPVACLLTPGAGNVQLKQQPLDVVQTRSAFGVLMVVLGGAQAVFFALFTGVFGINSIYEDRRQGTLQRVIVSPTPRSAILAGRLLGNLIVVMTQLLILLLALTAITSVVERQLTFIWGTNVLALLLVVFGLSLFTSGLGVLVVGLARTPDQVRLIGPLITTIFGALGGSFAFFLPRGVAQLSPIWWGTEALRKLAAGEFDIGLHVAVLLGVGLLFAIVGTFFFRRRMELI
ncbi:MAG: ABC transporter permease [Caldilineaceae bacterium]